MNVVSLRQWMAGYSSHSRGMPHFYERTFTNVHPSVQFGRWTIQSVPKPWKMVIIISRPGAEEEHAKEYPWQLMQ